MGQIAITGREEWTGRFKENSIELHKEGVVGISNSKIVGMISTECSKNTGEYYFLIQLIKSSPVLYMPACQNVLKEL